MRVLQLGPLPPPHGGVQVNLVAIRNHLLENGVPCEVINITRHRKTDGKGVYYPKSWLQLLWLLKTLKYDILHLHIGGRLTARLLALSLLCSMIPRKKSVLTFHSGGYPGSREGRTASKNTLRGFIFRRFDAIIAVNEEIVDLFRRFGVAQERLNLILPYDLPGSTSDVQIPKKIEEFFKHHNPVLITVSQLEPEYQLPMQIDVLGLVRETHAKSGLIIIGSGSIENELLAHINSKPYLDDIMLCGDTPHPVTLGLIDRSSVFLRTTAYDGDAISVRESLHLGTPVVATDTGMRPAGVRLIPMSDAEALRVAIEEQLAKGVSGQPAPRPGRNNIALVYVLYKELLKR